MDTTMLQPVIALVLWTLLIWLWMYAARLPAMQAARIRPDDARFPGALDVLPGRVRQVADNHNHLHEQPTLFYAVALAGALAGLDDSVAVALAWAYVGLRVLHSLVQTTVNRVLPRFALFVAGTLALGVLAIRTALAVF